MGQPYTQSGDVIDHVIAGTDAAKGEFRASGDLVVCLLDKGVVGETVPAARAGRFRVSAQTDAAWVAGEKIYKTAASQVFTKTAAANVFAGYVAAAKLSATATGEIVLAGPGVDT
jgi:predicted RecA/RadA family phage recombinase